MTASFPRGIPHSGHGPWPNPTTPCPRIAGHSQDVSGINTPVDVPDGRGCSSMRPGRVRPFGPAHVVNSMENGMPFPRAMLVTDAVCPELGPDWIEQKIIRAYVQLAIGPYRE